MQLVVKVKLVAVIASVAFLVACSKHTGEEVANEPSTSGQSVASATANPESVASNTEGSQTSASSDDEASGDFGVTPRQYADSFNGTMKTLNLPYRLKSTVKAGVAKDVLETQLSDLLSVVASVDKKTGKVKDAMLMATGDGSKQSGLEIMGAALALVSGAVPDVDRKFIGPKITKLIEDGFNADDHKASLELNGVRVKFTQGDLFFFTVEPST